MDIDGSKFNVRFLMLKQNKLMRKQQLSASISASGNFLFSTEN